MSRRTTERGAVMIETLFVLLVWALLFFLIIRINQYREDMQVLRHQAHRQTFWKATTEYDLYLSGPNIPGNAGTTFGYQLLVGHPLLQVAGIDASVTPNNVPNWLDPSGLTVDGVEGWGWSGNDPSRASGRGGRIRYGILPDWTDGFAGSTGPLWMTRFGSARRSSWTWTGAPFVWTQDWSEKNNVQNWFTTAYDHCLPANIVNSYQLNDAPSL